MLSAQNIRKSYGSLNVLRDVNLTIEPGKISVLIGPSGSGKTTLLKVLALLDYPDQGTVSVDSRCYSFPPAGKQKIEPPWPTVTVVFQQLFLWPHLTLLQNMTLPLVCRKTDENPPLLKELIGLFDMEGFVHRYPNEASLGQRQRAALVRALLLNPQYILMDEITSSLDVEQVSVILSYLRTLSQRGIGILTITHLLHFAREAADHVTFIDSGEILEDGGPEVLKSPRHERVRKFLSVIESAS